MRKDILKVVESKEIVKDIFSLTVENEWMAKEAKAGQFVNLYTNDAARLLPRPISICDADREKNTIRFVYRIAGKGTREFSELKAGDELMGLGTIGNGFALSKGENLILIGGGIGIPPMLCCAKELKKLGKRVVAVLGYRNADTFLLEEFKEICETVVATEDGSLGTKGNVIDAIKEENVSGDMILACGPMPMLRGIKKYSEENGIKAQISLEERMACGVGACLGCVCRTVKKDDHSHVNNARVCKDGPVFMAEDVDI